MTILRLFRKKRLPPIAYELHVEMKDVLGETQYWQFFVIATNQKDVEERIESMTHFRKEIASWNIVQWVSEEILTEDSHYAKEFKRIGCHAYYAPLQL